MLPSTRLTISAKLIRGAPIAEPIEVLPTRNATRSPWRYRNSPFSFVNPLTVGVWYFKPEIGPEKLPV